MYQMLEVEPELHNELTQMFDRLGEPPQVLTPDSGRPLVVHRVMGQITFVAQGCGRASLDGDEYPVRPGTLILMSPNCPHAFVASDGHLVLRHSHWPIELLTSDREILRDAHVFHAG